VWLSLPSLIEIDHVIRAFWHEAVLKRHQVFDRPRSGTVHPAISHGFLPMPTDGSDF
jgi:hypothetical protein